MSSPSRRPSLRIETLETRTLFAADLGMSVDLAAAAAPMATQEVVEDSLARPVSDILTSSGNSNMVENWGPLGIAVGDWNGDGFDAFRIDIAPINDGPINTIAGDWDGDLSDDLGLAGRAATTSVDRPALVDRAFGSIGSTSPFDGSCVDADDFVLWRYFILPTNEFFR